MLLHSIRMIQGLKFNHRSFNLRTHQGKTGISRLGSTATSIINNGNLRDIAKRDAKIKSKFVFVGGKGKFSL